MHLWFSPSLTSILIILVLNYREKEINFSFLTNQAIKLSTESVHYYPPANDQDVDWLYDWVWIIERKCVDSKSLSHTVSSVKLWVISYFAIWGWMICDENLISTKYCSHLVSQSGKMISKILSGHHNSGSWVTESPFFYFCPRPLGLRSLLDRSEGVMVFVVSANCMMVISIGGSISSMHTLTSRLGLCDIPRSKT